MGDNTGFSSSIGTTASTPDLGYLTPAMPEPTSAKNGATPRLSSALFAAAEVGEASIAVVFGGQSSANSSCVEQAAGLYSLYQHYVEPLVAAMDTVLGKLSTSFPEAEVFFLGREISIRNWFTDPSSRPDGAFIASAPVSLPMIGLLDLMHYCVIGKTLDKTPGQLRKLLSGMTGHSQGIIIAAALARSDCNSWEDFVRVAAWAVELLFWIGWEFHAAAPQAPLSPSAISDSVESGPGIPSHMLSVRGLERSQLDKAVAACNHNLKHEPNQHLYVALFNGPRSYTVAGAPRSLFGLTLRLAAYGQAPGTDQSRIPFGQRKPQVSCHFLAVSAPFHTPHLAEAGQRVKHRFAVVESTSRTGRLTVSDLDLALFHTRTGRDVRDAYPGMTVLADVLVDAIATEKVNWPKTLGMTRIEHDVEHAVSHMIVLGSGRHSILVHQSVDGLGIRVIDGTSFQLPNQAGDAQTAIGSRAELFDLTLAPWQLKPQTWKAKYAPRVQKNFLDLNSDEVNLASLTAAKSVENSTTHYTYTVETRLNRILNAPPVMVAGMTPTTVHPDFVGAVINAGYHIELAGGGYFDDVQMSVAIDTLTAQIPAGRGITINLIYASPVAMGWQIPLLQTLIRRGVPIEGLTIGAGVPSPDIVAGYIENLGSGTVTGAKKGAGGLRHISFKPGTAASIREVIAIARSHPRFPIILQWTGGRGGGHHSTEDFHEPLLETYSEIRRCENLYLVVGSGFGDGAGMLPYFTGEWSVKFERPAMPVDGVLLGSRMMVAREAHTSPQAKKLLLKASGVGDSEWQTSYAPWSSKSTVLTVVSEMGQPIHKLATRGVRLWKELDETVFSLPRSERKAALQKRKHEIIRRLNADSHRPWFGRDTTGKSVDLEDMTYTEVLCRLVQLMYVNHQQRWVDSSYQELFQVFATRVLERLSFGSSRPSTTSTNTVQLKLGSESPPSLLVKINAACPEAATQILHPEDSRVFVQLCRARGRKPANFILDIDEDFEHWFKKDSLWQSEDVDAVIDQDADRVCILHSPVSLSYATRDDQSAGEILDGVQHELGSLIEVHHATSGHPNSVQSLSPLSSASSWVEEGMPAPITAVSGVRIERTRSHLVLRPDIDDLDHEVWRSLLRDHISSPALSALLSEATVSRAKADARDPVQPNGFRQIFAPRRGFSVHVHVSEDELLLVHDKDRHTKTSVLVRVSVSRSSPREPGVRSSGGTHIRIQLYHHHGQRFSARGNAHHEVNNTLTQLMLDWKYDAKARRLLDIMESGDRDRRVQKFFAQLWLPGNTASIRPLTDKKTPQEESVPVLITPQIYETLHATVNQAFGSASPIPRFQRGHPIPIEAAVVAAWDGLMQPLVSPELRGDLLRLVHRSIGVQIEPGEAPLSVGEELSSQSRVRAITIEPSGKSIKVQVDVFRKGGRKAATVTSEFFIRGHFDDWQGTFRNEDREFEVQVGSRIDETVLRDREWFRLDPAAAAASLSLVGMTLVFRLNTDARLKDQSSFSSIKTYGTVSQKTWNGAMKPIGSVLFETNGDQGSVGGDPVVDYLERKGKEVRVDNEGFTKMPLQSPGWNGDSERIVTAPMQRQSRLYATVSGDLNPIHTSPVFAFLAEIPGETTIVHGMYTVAVCRQVVEELCGLSTGPEERARLRRFSADLVGMVGPGDEMRISIAHEAMIGGRMVLQVTARLVATGEVVVQGEAEIEQPATAYVFTGQGSQSQGMGMALYESSSVAKAVWDEMDRFLMDQYGWSIIRIIKDNPTELTVHFGGSQGQKVLRNYLAMTAEVSVLDPSNPSPGAMHIESRPLFPSITPESESHTFRDSRGLVHASQFAQPSIMLLEKATIEHLRANGLLQQNAAFAGHSLGEWGAISSMSAFVEFSAIMTIGFYRGMLMHSAIQRNEQGLTGHSMVAINPKRVGKGFDDAALRKVVGHIAHASGQLMEIVNYNVEAEQYVAAAHVRNIHVITQFLDAISSRPPAVEELHEFLSAASENYRGMTRLGQQVAALVKTSRSLPLDVELRRGRATIPLTAIDIPFHSNMLRPGIAAFRRFQKSRIRVEDFRPELVVDKWIPNVIGKEFSLDLEYFKKAAEVTRSDILEDIVTQISVQ
ncbi:Fatty acid synthase subunit beta 1 [Seiridium cupressi]